MSRNMKSVIVYISTALFAFVFDRVYALFSHGVGSLSMSLIWVWLLCFGAVFYLLAELLRVKIKKSIPDRLSANIYNSGVTVYAVGMLLQGILEIAGTASNYLLWYKIIGISLMIIGFGMILFFQSYNKAKNKQQV